jgi:hypothetical protein
MDYAKLSKFILILGVVLACIGGFKFLSNLPSASSQAPSSSGNNIAGMVAQANQMEKDMETQALNQDKSIRRSEASKVIGAGVIIIFVAVAIMLSARKPKPV